MSRLIRLYPRSWRERYEEELTVLLEDRPPGPSDVLDLLLGALDAHLHRRAAGSRPAWSRPERDRGPHRCHRGGGGRSAPGPSRSRWRCRSTGAWRPTDGTLELTLSLLVVALAALSAVQARSHRSRCGRPSSRRRSVSPCWSAERSPRSSWRPSPDGRVHAVCVLDGRVGAGARWVRGLRAVLSAVTGALPHWTSGLLSAGAVVQLVTILATDHAKDEWLMLLGAVTFGLACIGRADGGPLRALPGRRPVLEPAPSDPTGAVSDRLAPCAAGR